MSDVSEPDNVSNLTIKVLEKIHAELRELRGDLGDLRGDVQGLQGEMREVRGELQTLNTRVETLSDRVETGFADVNRRLDGALAIAGGHHTDLESRVKRIETHLGLP